MNVSFGSTPGACVRLMTAGQLGISIGRFRGLLDDTVPGVRRVGSAVSKDGVRFRRRVRPLVSHLRIRS